MSQTAGTSPAGQPATAPEDPLEASRKIEEKIAKLAELPVAKEMSEIQSKMSVLRNGIEKQIEPLTQQYRQLQESDAGKDYFKQLNDLQALRNQTWEREQKAIAEAARKIYSARHEELQKATSRPAPNLGKLGLDVLSYPRVDGSTSTHPLSVIIACRTFGVPYEWIYPEPSGYPYHNRPELPRGLFMERAMSGGYYRDPMDMDFDLAASRVIAKPAKDEQERLAIIINSLLGVSANTHAAYENLINRKCDLNLTARAPSEDELKLAKDKGVKIAIKPIAKDAMVFIVNYKNGVKNLTLKQVVDIYDGKIKTWPELGWKPDDKDLAERSQNISPLRRERNSGSRELFDALVMKGRQLPEDSPWAKSMFSSSMSGPYNRLTVEPGALGYSVYYYEHFMAASAFTRPIAIDGVEPTPETIASGKYPLVAEVYAAYREGEPADSPAVKMLNWLISPEGQAVVKESGYVPVGK